MVFWVWLASNKALQNVGGGFKLFNKGLTKSYWEKKKLNRT